MTKKSYGTKNKRVVIVLGGWESRQFHFWLLANLLASFNYKVIVITWDKSILTSDIILTKNRFIEVRDDVIATIRMLPKKEQQHITLFGTSQGSTLAFMVANEVREVDKVIANLSGADVAEIVWSWTKKVHSLKAGIVRKKVTLKRLKTTWSDLSPQNLLNTFQKKKVLLYMAQKDEVIPYAQQQKLLEVLREKNISVEVVMNTRYNHFMTLLTNLCKCDIYLRFLRKK